MLRRLQRDLLIALLRAQRTLLVIKCELLVLNARTLLPHPVARLAEAGVDEELAVAVVLGHGITIIVFRTALIEHFLTRVEIRSDTALGGRRSGVGRDLCEHA